MYKRQERGWSFIKKAGTVILLATIFVWFTSSFGWENGSFGMVDMESSILAVIGNAIAWIFTPLGWGTWQAAVASITGLIAKENVVGTFGVLFGGFEEVAENGWQVWQNVRAAFTPLAAYSFLIFNPAEEHAEGADVYKRQSMVFGDDEQPAYVGYIHHARY